MAALNATFACIVFLLLLFSSTNNCEAKCFKSIISFGDSLTDTGNLIHLSENSNYKQQQIVQCGSLPYGETFFHRPTGRCSDGRLVIDFLAESLGLPLVPPYIGRKNVGSRNFREGVNFAVAGATALNHSLLEELGIYNPQTNVSLGTQLRWFKEMLSSLCQSSSECKDFLKSSLILFGEIGGNDYNFPLLGGMPIQMVQSMVPLVINNIGQIINEVIELGAETLIVPGNLPLGCLPAYLDRFMSTNKNDYYDPNTGCINWLNEFSEYHNVMLQVELNRLQQLHPHATIIYGDYYNALMQLYLSPQKYGFKSAIVACCGGKGPYQVDISTQCGDSSANVCDDPSTFVSWDGIHSTETAYKWMAQSLISGPFAIPHINELCTFKVYTT
ncbi:GDSL esterase/lipase At1g28610-like isoform X1 [Lycium ferocissimum]|uniref:GDSL esterase/lipase At1g28610-like isoform X1 n=1 Tax=Lycium ferocissimum TaxID=112874 RepID=UPI002815000B|nr:GDSL esterase/lipase At1g28610-like isoform X1 [Lycium ferocissimum]